jgi:agmatine deiminase
VVLVQTTTDAGDPNHDRLLRNVDALVAAGYEVIEIDLLPRSMVGADSVVVPPLNLYLAQGAAVVPVVDGPEAEAALDLLGVALPDREIVGVPGAVLAFGGGGVHCITQQVPR